jgi:hypothetical protein
MQLIYTYVTAFIFFVTAGAIGQNSNGITVGLGTLKVGMDWPHKAPHGAVNLKEHFHAVE